MLNQQLYTAKKILLLPMMPTPNGPLHLGHIAGPYLKMDVFARYLRQNGAHVILMSCSDAFESHVKWKANQLNEDPVNLSSYYHQKITENFAMMNIQMQYFINPLSPEWRTSYQQTHIQLVKKLLETNKAHIIQEEYLYSPSINNRVLSCTIIGKCPACYASVKGYFCESCGIQFNAKQIINPILLNDQDFIWQKGSTIAVTQQNIDETTKNIRSMKLLYPFKKAMCKYIYDPSSIIRLSTLDDHSVTHFEYNNHVFNLYNSYFGYSLFCGEVYKQSQNYPYNAFDNHSEVITATSCGLDNTTDLICDVICANADSQHKSFDYHFGNFFLTLDNKKFSTSNNHAIFVSDIYKINNIDIDALRCYLALHSPESSQQDMTMNQFINFHNNWFIDKLYLPIKSMIYHLKTSNLISCPTDIKYLLEKYLFKIHNTLSFDNFSFNQYANLLLAFLSEIKKIKGNNNSEYWMIKAFSLLAYPLMPDICKEIWHKLGHSCDPTITEYYNYHGINKDIIFRERFPINQ